MDLIICSGEEQILSSKPETKLGRQRGTEQAVETHDV